MEEDILVLSPPLGVNCILLIAGEWDGRGSSCLWPPSTPSPWACRLNTNINANLNMNTNSDINTNTNTNEITNTNTKFTTGSHASPYICRSPICRALVLRSGEGKRENVT